MKLGKILHVHSSNIAIHSGLNALFRILKNEFERQAAQSCLFKKIWTCHTKQH